MPLAVPLMPNLTMLKGGTPALVSYSASVPGRARSEPGTKQRLFVGYAHPAVSALSSLRRVAGCCGSGERVPHAYEQPLQPISGSSSRVQLRMPARPRRPPAGF